MDKYVLYRRVSTKEQGRSGLGLEAQERDIELYLTNYAGEYQVIAQHTDVDSGSQENTELLSALDICRKEGAILLVSKLDRLSRRVSFIASLMEDKTVRFKVAAMPHAGNFELHIYAALAEQERKFISVRTKAALAAAKAHGVKLGGDRGGLQKANERRAALAMENAEKLRDIVKPLRSMGKTLIEISASLNRQGHLAPGGGAWTPTQVKRVLDRLDRR